jgi:hypothetical protein
MWRGGLVLKQPLLDAARISEPLQKKTKPMLDVPGEMIDGAAMAQYAQYGVTSRSIPVMGDGTWSCYVFCKGWPSWFWAAVARGFWVKRVILSTPYWKSSILAHSPSTEVLIWDRTLKFAWESVTVVLSDLSLSGQLNAAWEYVTHSIVLPKAVRQYPGSWNYHKLDFKHYNFGGVTDGKWIQHLYSSAKNVTPFSLESQAARDASTLLDPMASGGLPCKAPQPVMKGDSPAVVLVRKDLYHGSGLIPWADPAPRVVTPNVFSPTKWCCRKLSLQERLYSRDLSKCSLNLLSSKQQGYLVEDTSFIPEKCCLGIIDAVMTTHTSPLPLTTSSAKSTSALALGINRLTPVIDALSDDPEVSLSERFDKERANKRMQAATKADDAEVPTELWDSRILPQATSEQRCKNLTPLRNFFLRWWRKNVRCSFLTWFWQQYRNCVVGHTLNLKRIFRTKRAYRDWVAGKDCIRRCSLASWWEWDAGSRPLHWRWPLEYQEAIRDGLPPWFSTAPPTSTIPQRGELDPEICVKVAEKLLKVRNKGYLEEGPVKSLTSFFKVPKGDKDVRVVYNGTKSGLNACLWAPWFRLPTVEQHLRAVDVGTYLSDIDVAEQFHNVIMHQDIRPFAGVDVTAFFPNEFVSYHQDKRTRRTVWLRWNRCGIGFKMSPYNAGQAMLHAEEVVRGDHKDPTNPFCFDCIQLNIPGQADYNPALPWVYKFRYSDSKIANNFFVYVDDVRTTGSMEEDCWACSRAVASRYSYLGLQDASRKRCGPLQEAGPWAGSTVHTSNGRVTVTVTMDRWAKAKAKVQWLHDLVCPVPQPIPFKQLESDRGYLVYLSRTYPALVPYLKGIHLTLDSWRPHRDPSGWKIATSAALSQEGEGDQAVLLDSAPDVVVAVGQLQDDMTALMALFTPEIPPLRPVRLSRTATAIYGFGDASGLGFGTTLLIHGSIHYRHGQWSTSVSEESSNYRELNNLILGIEEAVTQGPLDDCEVFLFTDNSMAESVFHKGTSSSKTLFQLVLRLRLLQMHRGLFIKVIHVAGTRMQAQGTDDLSRGSLSSGVLRGGDMLSYVPLHLSCLDRSSLLRLWIQTWFVTFLDHLGWFTTGHQHGAHIWSPPPGAADVALEQLAVAIHKRPSTFHLVAIPRLMTASWRKLLGKICDFVFTVPLGVSFWHESHFEPLVLGIYFPLLPFSPWQL